MKLSAREIGIATKGRVIQGSPEAVFHGVSTDSRTIRPGQLFVPLSGSRFNGHDFIVDALRAGAAGFLFDRAQKLPAALVAIQVSDTLQALSDLAAWTVKKLNAPVVAVAGSNGKTTTKELIAQTLFRRFRTHATMGNHNTEIGLPLTVLNAPDETEIFILEMGTTAPGDLKRLCQIAPPQIGVLTSISEEHVATLGNLEQIIEAETELLEALPPNGLAVINGDSSEFLEIARRKARCRLVTFGLSAQNDCVAEEITVSRTGTGFYLKTPDWQHEMSLPLLGRPAVLAALAATAVAQHCGLSFSEIRQGLAGARGPWGRLQLVTLGEITIVHDAYNANPASMREAILCAAQLRHLDERLIFVLGDMLELGALSERAHRQIGQLVTTPELRPDQLIVVGSWARLIGEEAAQAGVRVRHFVASDEAAAALASELTESEEPRLILLKGSRGMRLEKLLDALSHHIPLPV